MTKENIIEKSKLILDLKNDITSINTSISGYEDGIKDVFKMDSNNRTLFIDNNSLVSGLTLEFRNLYGIQAPYYDITDCSIGLDKNANGILTEDEYITLENDSKTFKDSKELFNAAMFDFTASESSAYLEFDGIPPVDKQRFFVDSNKKEESSEYFEPFCPPGLDKWSGTYLQKYICKNFDLTEKVIFDLLDTTPTTDKSFTVDGFTADNPISYNLDENGKLTKNQYNYNIKDSDLDKIAASGSNVYSITNATDKAPIVYYNTKMTAIPNLDPTTGKYNTSYSGPFYLGTDSIFVKYTLSTRKTYTSYDVTGRPSTHTITEPFCNGYAILSKSPDAVFPSASDGKTKSVNFPFCVNLLSKSGSVIPKERYTYSSNYNWINSWYTTKRHTRYYSEEGQTAYPVTYFAEFEPAVLDINSKKSIVSFYKKMLEETTGSYDAFLKSGVACKIDINKSVETQKNILDAIKQWEDSDYSDSIFRNVLIPAIHTRIKYAYNVPENVNLEWSKELVNPTDSVLHVYNTVKKLYENSIVIDDLKEQLLPRIEELFGNTDKAHFDDNTKYNLYATPDSFIESVKDIAGYWEKRTISSLIEPTYEWHWHNRSLNYIITTYEYTVHTEEEALTEYKTSFLYNMPHQDKNNVSHGSGSYPEVPSDRSLTGKMDSPAEISITIKRIRKPNSGVILNPPYRANEINIFLEHSPQLYSDIFNAVSARIDKRTGTLRSIFRILSNANIAMQSCVRKKENFALLFKLMTAYDISNGIGTERITISLCNWEPDVTVYANLNRMSEVYIVTDDPDKFLKTKIVDIDKVNTAESDVGEINTDLTNISTKTEPSGAMFEITLIDQVPEDFIELNPRIVKLIQE